MSEHTELPWKVTGNVASFIRSNGKIIAEADSTVINEGKAVQDKMLDRANAEFIVLACNAHKKLLDVVEPLLEAYYHMAQTLQSDIQFQGDQLTQRAKDAIAAATP